MVAAAADDGRRRVAAEGWARFGSGRDKWRESWESRENMLCIRADEVSSSDRQAWEYSSSQEKLLEQIGRTCLSLRCANKLWHGDAAPEEFRRSVPSGDVAFWFSGRPVAEFKCWLRRAAGPRPACPVQGEGRETGGPVTTRGGAADGSYGVGRERSINAGHHSADLGTTTLLARTELCKQPHPGPSCRETTRNSTLYTRFEGH